MCLVFQLQFLDMSSLQAALPDALLPATFHGGIAEPWLPQNTVTPYISSAGEGNPQKLVLKIQISLIQKSSFKVYCLNFISFAI